MLKVSTVVVEEFQIDDDTYEFKTNQSFSQLKALQAQHTKLNSEDLPDEEADEILLNLLLGGTNVPAEKCQQLPLAAQLAVLRHWAELVQGTLAPLVKTIGETSPDVSDTTEADPPSG